MGHSLVTRRQMMLLNLLNNLVANCVVQFRCIERGMFDLCVLDMFGGFVMDNRRDVVSISLNLMSGSSMMQNGSFMMGFCRMLVCGSGMVSNRGIVACGRMMKSRSVMRGGLVMSNRGLMMDCCCCVVNERSLVRSCSVMGHRRLMLGFSGMVDFSGHMMGNRCFMVSNRCFMMSNSGFMVARRGCMVCHCGLVNDWGLVCSGGMVSDWSFVVYWGRVMHRLNMLIESCLHNWRFVMRRREMRKNLSVVNCCLMLGLVRGSLMASRLHQLLSNQLFEENLRNLNVLHSPMIHLCDSLDLVRGMNTRMFRRMNGRGEMFGNRCMDGLWHVAHLRLMLVAHLSRVLVAHFWLIAHLMLIRRGILWYLDITRPRILIPGLAVAATLFHVVGLECAVAGFNIAHTRRLHEAWLGVAVGLLHVGGVAGGPEVVGIVSSLIGAFLSGNSDRSESGDSESKSFHLQVVDL